MSMNPTELSDDIVPATGKAEQARQLRHDDMDGDAGEEAGNDRRREQVGNPAEPQQATDREQGSDH